MLDITDLRDRYVAVWNEADAAVRDEAVACLWTEDGVQLVQAPQDVAERTAPLGLQATLEARGHAALRVRVARAYGEFVAAGRYRFRAQGEPVLLRDVVKFRWEMVSGDDGEIAAVGLELLLLAPDGRIREDLQFIES